MHVLVEACRQGSVAGCLRLALKFCVLLAAAYLMILAIMSRPTIYKQMHEKSRLSRSTDLKQQIVKSKANSAGEPFDKDLDKKVRKRIAVSPNCTSTLLKEPYYFCQTGSNSSTYLLTLITTMRNHAIKNYLYVNALRMWKKLDNVKPVLYITQPKVDQNILKAACQFGWDVLVAPQCSVDGYPVLREMFRTAERRYKSTYLGYANGDIMFDTNLLDTLKFIDRQKAHYNEILIVGQRHNGILDKNHHVKSFETIREIKGRSDLFWTRGIDYAITRPYGYPWKDVPPFVIGRIWWDTWVIWFTQNKGSYITAIDTTHTVTALHQEVKGHNFSSLMFKTAYQYNKKWLPKDFDKYGGLTSCADMITQYKNQTRTDFSLLRRLYKGGCRETNRTPDKLELVATEKDKRIS